MYENLDEYSAKKLGYSIALMAVHDYLKLAKEGKVEQKSVGVPVNKWELETFFLGEYFNLLVPDMSGKVILEALEKKVSEGNFDIPIQEMR